MVLLDVLCQLREELGFDLCVGHLDHGLRADSGMDAEFVSAAASELGLAIHTRRVDVGEYARQAGLSVEAAGRERRYRFLEEIMKASGSRFIATGHHASDQAETVLMRMLRGSGTRGLAAMEPVRDGHHLRPLLQFDRRTVIEYAQLRGLEYRQDLTNADTRFLRNRIRHQLLPLLESEYNPGLTRILTHTAAVLRDEDDALARASQTALETVVCVQEGKKIILAVPPLLRYHIAVQRRVLRQLLADISSGETEVGFDAVECLVDLAHDRSRGIVHLGADLRAQHWSEWVVIRDGSPGPIEASVQLPGVTRVTDRDLTVEARFLPASSMEDVRPLLGPWRAVLDADEIGHCGLSLRSPREGDRMQPLGMPGGSKKISDLLVDEKWPRLLRDEVVLVTRGEQIAWAAGLRIGQPFRVTPTTKQLLFLEISGAFRYPNPE